MHLVTRVVALTPWSTQSMPRHAMRAGIDGYRGKDIDLHEFEKALYKIWFGRRYISQAIAHDFARYADGDLSDHPFQLLSVREAQIMVMVLGCKNPNAIASLLNLSAKTVNSYRYRFFEKLWLKSDVQLTLLAVRHNVIELRIRETSGGEEVAVSQNRQGPLAFRQQSHEALASTLGISRDDKYA